MGTSVPPIQFTEEGLIIPSSQAVLAGTQADINAAFGGGVNPALNTPQGQLASSLAAICVDKDTQVAEIVNQVDPQYADGRFQDAIARFYFLTRKPALPTAVICTLGGLPTTVIPAGTLAQDTNGNTYILTATATIGSGSTVAGTTWQNIATGPIACPAGSLTKVYQQISGWDTITNPADGVLGQNVESRIDFEFRRQNSVALNGRSTTESIYANVFQVSNTLDCFVVDNPAGIVVDYGPTNYPLAAHSVFVSVVGGDDADIATAIWNKKDVGCNYAPYPAGGSPVPGHGTVSTQTVTDESGYEFPFPSYQVSFLRPGALPILFAVQIVNAPNLPSDIVTQIQNAIIAQFSGNTDFPRARIGSTLIAANYYANVAALGQNVQLLSILVGTSVANQTTVGIGIDQVPTINSGDITVSLI